MLFRIFLILIGNIDYGNSLKKGARSGLDPIETYLEISISELFNFFKVGI